MYYIEAKIGYKFSTRSCLWE